MHRITKGLDVPITGEPEQNINEGPPVSRVALIGPDYIGMKPTMLVQPGDVVKIGQALFEDKKTPGVTYTSPAGGKVLAINRGAKRAFQSLVIEIGEQEEAVEFQPLARDDFGSVSREAVTELLTTSGLWPSFRTRPFNKVPQPGSVPSSIFVQAIDTNPLAADPAIVIREREQDFQFGLMALTRLTDGDVHVCRRPAMPLPGEQSPGVSVAEFEGPHPSGLPGTHIHLIDPVGPNRTVWTINYQDVIAIGHLMTNGTLKPERVISLAGPSVSNPRLIRTRVGASIDELVANEVQDGNHRIVSGSVLSGRTAKDDLSFLGRYHLQVSVIEEGDKREFLGWMSPGSRKFSVRRIFTSALDRTQRFAFTTSTEGSERAMVPIGMYEQVMPLDIIPTFLLRSLIVGDTEQAQALGCLELDEEDLALCTFVCPGKYEYGPILRTSLTEIELDG